jgi:polysaccharide biosynthesis/export protein
MPERKGRWFLRCAEVVIVGICSLYLRAQTPVAPGAPAPNSPQQESPAAPPDTTPAKSSSASGVVPNSNVKLGIGDLVEVTVYGVPDLTTKARVSGSGDLYLPLIDYVHVEDLTSDEAQELIQKRLADGGFVRDPHVTIFVDESASQAITILGEVAHPGPYPAIGERRLFDLISAAGGLTDRAGRAVTIEHRADPENKVVVKLSSNLADDASTSNVEVRPGDMIIVSRAGIIYVVGDVGHASGFLIEDNTLTVLKALALAGGSTKTSALNRTRILRETPNGIQEIPVPLKKILYAKAPDVPLLKGDVLFVPGSPSKAVAYESAQVAMAVSTTLAVVAVHP